MDKLKDIVITDEDITWVESVLGEGLQFDDSRRTIIKSLESKDIQAFPGSGKTTVLVAKLAILAKKWPFAHCGICVLSHTNVAREEIEERLGNTEVGKTLLSYPHFIGTFHSFFDTHVALPWLRSKGMQINMIDTDIVQRIRWHKLEPNIRKYLEHQKQNESICGYKGTVGSIDWDKKGKTKDSILKIIGDTQDTGYFTFDEMLLYAKEALSQCSYLPTSIQNRFPILFIDEAQDTNTFQWDLIHSAFSCDGDLSLRQGFGDRNQAIYNYMNETVDDPEFPRTDPILLNESRRFDNSIAVLANSVAISLDKMDGTPNEFSEKNCQHTIFLFSIKKAEQVIEEFGKLVLNTFTDEELFSNNKNGCHVIGAVHAKKEETSDKHFPKGIYDYWSCYEAKKSNRNATPRYFIEYIRKGNTEFAETNEVVNLIEWIAKGIRRMINIAKAENYIVATNNTFSSLNKALSEENRITFRELIFEFIPTNVSTKEGWTHITDQIPKVLELFDATSNKSTNKFLSWIDDDTKCDVSCPVTSDTSVNCYIHEDAVSGRCVELKFGSIHSVKGRTHLATLVLETYNRTHNMKAIIKYLCNTPPKSAGSNRNRLKCQYVAMTRAKGLLCLAIPEKFVDENDRVKLCNAGWRIQLIK